MKKTTLTITVFDDTMQEVFIEKAFRNFFMPKLGSKNVFDLIAEGNETLKTWYSKLDFINSQYISKSIEHTMLSPETTDKEIKNLCHEALDHNFYSVCVNPCHVNMCSSLLINSNVTVCSVIAFPFGATTTEQKVSEAENAMVNGAKEIDMVMNIGKFKSEDYDYVYNDIKSVAERTKLHNSILKVIIETSLLSDIEKVKACLIIRAAGADFVKTSTGFGKSGAVKEDIALLKYASGNDIRVKASGGIKTKDDAIKMIYYGADRIGTSSGITITS